MIITIASLVESHCLYIGWLVTQSPYSMYLDFIRPVVSAVVRHLPQIKLKSCYAIEFGGDSL